MIDDIVNEHGIMVKCWENDAIKVNGVYVATPEIDVYNHIRVLAILNSEYMFKNRTTEEKYRVSDGICPKCYKKVMNEYKKVRDLQYRGRD